MFVCPEGYVELSREDAAGSKIVDGDQLKVVSATGSITLKAKVGSRLPKGVLFAPYHFAEASINNLTNGAAVTWVTISK